MITQQLTTGRLFWQQAGSDNWIPFGNCLSYSRKPRIERLKHLHKKDGLTRVDLNLPREVEVLWSFTFDEFFGELLKPLFLGSTLTDLITGGGVNIVAVPFAQLKVGRSYYLGFNGLTAITGANGAFTLVEGVDFTVDRTAGVITVLNIPDPASSFAMTTTQAGYTFQSLPMLASLLTQGTFKVIERDAQSDAPVNEETFTGQVYVTAWGENDQSKFSEYQVEVLFNPGLA